MSKNDYYDVLGVSKDSDPSSIKSAYRKLAMESSDKNREIRKLKISLKKSQRPMKFYQILKKQAYDTYGHEAFSRCRILRGFSGFGSFSDIFEDFFGDFGGRPQQRREQEDKI